MIPNLIICFTIYVLGHLVPLIVQSSVGKLAIVRFVGRLFATILPVLEHFTIEAAVIGGVTSTMGIPRMGGHLRRLVFRDCFINSPCAFPKPRSCIGPFTQHEHLLLREDSWL